MRTKLIIRTALICAAAISLTACGGLKERQARYTIRGQQYLAHGEFEKARLEFRNALQIAPKSADLRYYNGLVDEKLGNIQESVEYYRSAIAVNDDHIPARASLARLLVFAGLPNQALEQVDPALKHHPDSADLLIVRAVALQQKKDTAGALQAAQRAVSLEPKNENAIASLAGIEMHSGDTDSALKLIENAVARFPDSRELRSVQVQVYLDHKDVPGAERALLELVRLQPNEIAYRIDLAQLYAKTDRLDDAERALRAAIGQAPGDSRAKRALVELLWERRGQDVAEAEVREMIKATPADGEPRFMLATLYEKGGDAGRAEAAYTDVIQHDGTNVYGLQARDRLAAIYTARNNVPGAEKLVAEVLDKNPGDYDALALRASQELSRGAAEAAISDLRRILRDQPNAVSVLPDLARAYIADGEPQLAADTARRAVELDPSSVAARIGLAGVLISGGKPEESRTVLAELQKQLPDDPRVVDLQYRASLAMHDFATARSAAAELVRLQPKSAVGLVYLGIVAEQAGHMDEALANYQRALDMQPRAVEPLAAIVRLLDLARRFDEAEQVLANHARRVPDSKITPFLEGEVQLARGNHLPQAEAAFRLALAATPKSWGAYRGLALVEFAHKDPARAASILHDAALHAELAETQRFELAVLFTGAGKFEDAINQYETALKLNPKSTGAAAGLALLLVSFRTDDASLNRAVTLVQPFAASNDWRLLDAYGWVQFKNGDFAAAVPPLEKAAAQQPEESEVRFHLAMAQLKTGQGRLAEQNLAASVAHGTRFFGHDEAQAVLAQLRSGKSYK